MKSPIEHNAKLIRLMQPDAIERAATGIRNWDCRHSLLNYAERFNQNFGYRPSTHNLRHYTWIVPEVLRSFADIARDLTIISLFDGDDDHVWLRDYAEREDAYRTELRALATADLFSVLSDAHPLAPQSRIRAVSDHPQFVRAWREAQSAALHWLDAADVKVAA